MNLKKYLESLQLSEDNAKVFRIVASWFIGTGVGVFAQACNIEYHLVGIIWLIATLAVWLWLRLKVNR